MPKTIRERLIAALEAEGATLVKCGRKGFIAYKHPDKEFFYFIGTSGSFRYGGTAGGSIPHDKTKARLLATTKGKE